MPVQLHGHMGLFVTIYTEEVEKMLKMCKNIFNLTNISHHELKLSHVLIDTINIRIIDPFTIKPLDTQTILENAKATKGRIITVEDHYPEGEDIWKYSMFFSILQANRFLFINKITQNAMM